MITAMFKAMFCWFMDPYEDTAEPLPPPIQHLSAHKNQVRARYPHNNKRWRVSRRPLSRMAQLLRMRGHDTAVACFYRIYEFAVIGDNIRFRNEIEYFCHRPWPIASLPDPCDFDPQRAAFLSALTGILCSSFNERIERGLPRDAPAYISDFAALRAQRKILETLPPWAERIPGLSEPLFLASRDDDDLSEELRNMGIFMKAPHSSFT
ncbi:hypothetical protein B0H11DRAFT_2281087 [Mycena galericulata]|nr:hypothetical protein B0H11DRAFT_2281087 [Mycena galericulata]